MSTEASLLENSEIMTLSEIARYLRLSEKTVAQLAKSGELPAAKIASQWRFRKPAVDSWITARIHSAEDNELRNVMGTKKHLVPIPKLIPEQRIILDLKPQPKEDILKQLIVPLLGSSMLADPVAYLEQLIDRESILSTALCDGVAIPHVRDHETSGVKEACMVLGICREGAEFDSLDGEPTRLFFLICSPYTTTHLRLLAKLTMMLRQPDIIDKLCRAQNTQVVMSILSDAHFQMSIEM